MWELYKTSAIVESVLKLKKKSIGLILFFLLCDIYI